MLHQWTGLQQMAADQGPCQGPIRFGRSVCWLLVAVSPRLVVKCLLWVGIRAIPSFAHLSCEHRVQHAVSPGSLLCGSKHTVSTRQQEHTQYDTLDGELITSFSRESDNAPALAAKRGTF